jgi:hypothetical protein
MELPSDAAVFPTNVVSCIVTERQLSENNPAPFRARKPVNVLRTKKAVE